MMRCVCAFGSIPWRDMSCVRTFGGWGYSAVFWASAGMVSGPILPSNVGDGVRTRTKRAIGLAAVTIDGDLGADINAYIHK